MRGEHRKNLDWSETISEDLREGDTWGMAEAEQKAHSFNGAKLAGMRFSVRAPGRASLQQRGSTYSFIGRRPYVIKITPGENQVAKNSNHIE